MYIKLRIYYEKNLQGDVIGLLDARGAEIAAYTFDAWGNVIANALDYVDPWFGYKRNNKYIFN